MSKYRVAVLKVVAKQRSVTAAAAEYRMSRQHLQRLLRRYRDGGLEALEPRSRRPRTSPGRTLEDVRARIIVLRAELTTHGLDAGPMTIAWHLGREGLHMPSTSTIRRILHAAGAAHARRRVLAIADERDVTVVALDTGEVLSTHLIEPAKGYWRNQLRDPGRWPAAQTNG